MILRGHAVDRLGVESGDHGLGAHVAEQRDLGALAGRQRLLAAADQHVGLDTERGQVAHRMLGRLGL